MPCPCGATGAAEDMNPELIDARFSALDALGSASDRLCSAPDARAYFFLSCQEEVAKKKARPLRRPAAPGALRCSAATGGCGTRTFGPQTVLALFPVASCAARRRRGQVENQADIKRLRFQPPPGVHPPWKTPSNAGLSGVVGEHCLRAQPELRSPRSRRVAQGTPPQAGRRPGVAFSLAPFFWRSKRKDARASGAENDASAPAEAPTDTPE